MRPVTAAAMLTLGVVVAGGASRLEAQSREDKTVVAAAKVLEEINRIPLKAIPQSMLANCHGVAIVPQVIKGGFVVGARHGRGVLLLRDAGGAWQPPQFISLTGGNVGWQVGVQSTDVILVFKTQKSVEGILSGKFTVGADAAAAAGPLGRQAAAATDGKLQAEIYSYSRSRGLFAGVSLDGSVLKVDTAAAESYYGAVGGEAAPIPEAAFKLMEQVASLAAQEGSNDEAASAEPLDETTGFGPDSASAEQLAQQLAVAAADLDKLLDDAWRRHLALPPEVTRGDGLARVSDLEDALARYDAVDVDADYRALSERPEFVTAHDLLRRYVSARASAAGRLSLPAPPGSRSDRR